MYLYTHESHHFTFVTTPRPNASQRFPVPLKSQQRFPRNKTMTQPPQRVSPSTLLSLTKFLPLNAFIQSRIVSPSTFVSFASEAPPRNVASLRTFQNSEPFRFLLQTIIGFTIFDTTANPASPSDKRWESPTALYDFNRLCALQISTRL